MYKSDKCDKCKFFANTAYWPVDTPAGKTLFVIGDYPNKSATFNGKCWGKSEFQFLLNGLEDIIHRDYVYVTNAVKCYPGKERVNKPEAKTCFKSTLEDELEQFKGNIILLAGNYPPQMLLGRNIVEICNKIVRKGERIYICMHSPSYYLRKHGERDGYKYTKESERKAFEIYKTDLRNLFDKALGGDCDINLNEKIKLEYTVVKRVTEMVALIQGWKGEFLQYDFETICPEKLEKKEIKYKGMSLVSERSALDWQYGKEYCQTRCTGFGFFRNLEETTYTPGCHSFSYDPKKLVIYTGPVTTTLAKAIAKTKSVAFNSNYDSGVLARHSDVFVWNNNDPMDEAYVVNQSRKKFNLESLIFEYAPELAAWAGDIKQKGKATAGKYYREIDTKTLHDYCAGDVLAAAILFFKLRYYVDKQDMSFLYDKIICGVKPILRDMEARGIMLNDTLLNKKADEYMDELRQLCRRFLDTPEVAAYNDKVKTEHAYAEAKREKDIRVSNAEARKHNEFLKQTGEKKGRKRMKTYKPKGVKLFNPRSNDIVLACIKHSHPDWNLKNTTKGTLKDKYAETDNELLKVLLDYRVASKKMSTYVTGLAKKREGEFVYASFKTNSTASGRTSSGGTDSVGLGKTNQINIQNQPRGADTRQIFKARPGYYLAYADYSQIEVRVAGAYGKSPEIAAVCHDKDADFHSMIASRAFQIPYDMIIKNAKEREKFGDSFRQASKVISFGTLYGMTPEGIASTLGWKLEDGSWDIETAAAFTQRFFEGMPSVKTWINNTRDYIIEHKKARTVFGRERKFPYVDEQALRQGVNTYVQATASDIFLLSLVSQHKLLSAAGLYGTKVFPWAEVHDSMTWEVHNSVPKEEAEALMKKGMLEQVRTDYPKVDYFLGDITLHVDFKTTEVWV